MNHRLLASLALASVVSLGQTVHAEGETDIVCGDHPGSLLVYPCFDNTRGTQTYLTVTNTNDDVVAGSVLVEFVYIDEETCLEFNRTHLLTANDTLTVYTRVHNPDMVRGYAYAFAKSITTGECIKWDFLIGTDLFLTSIDVHDFEANAIVFQASKFLETGANTDTDADGVKDLNGHEYVLAPDEILVPRFFGNIPNRIKTELVLIGLTGGRFTTLIDFLVYNDNEEVFSAQYAFDCWDRVPLTDISGVFTRSFLLTTNQNPYEIQGVPGAAAAGDGGAPAGGGILEAGWYRMDGNIAQSTTTSVVDPAFLAMQLERRGDAGVASLPFTVGSQDNGGLLSLSLMGNQ